MHKHESSTPVQSDSYGIQSNPRPPEIKEEQVEMEQSKKRKKIKKRKEISKFIFLELLFAILISKSMKIN